MKLYMRYILQISSFVCIYCICIHFTRKYNVLSLINWYSNEEHFLPVQKYLNGLVSSLWCTEDLDKHKLCAIKHLCYLPDSENQFLFIVSNETVMSGIKGKEELKTLSLTSVFNHNGFPLKLVITNETNWDDGLMKNEEIFVMSRFKADNIMHVIHDDLLPLYVTYNKICEGDVYKCVSKYRLAFLDGHSPGPYYDWYKLLSDREPIFLEKERSMVCFEKVRIGLSKESVWFQYGFRTVHGPIQPVIDSIMLKQFSDFVFGRFKIDQNIVNIYQNVGVFFSRRFNRKINNEEFVLQETRKVYEHTNPGKSLNLMSLDMATNDSKIIIALLRKSSVLVGMHGSAMILSIFLPPGAIIIELFPFGLQPQHISPVKAMCNIQGIYFLYFPWVNINENNSVMHEDFPPLIGGISYLPKEMQEHIKTVKLVPPVSCCHSPIYLYRMYQDTIIDKSFTAVLKEAFTSQIFFKDNHVAYIQNYQFGKLLFPSVVTNVTCLFTNEFVIISWNKPLNVNYYNPEYKLHIVFEEHSYVYSTNTSSIVIKISKQHVDKVQVWINCRAENNEGIDVYAEC